MSLISGGIRGLIAATDGVAATVEALQFSTGEGPCVDASRWRRPVLQPDLDTSSVARWPGFAAGAVNAGVRTVFAFPLHIGGIHLGVLDLHRNTAGSLTATELAEAVACADAATALLLHLQRRTPEGAALHPALADRLGRIEVHQATGMVMVQARVSLADAMLLLRARAFADDRPIKDLARDVLIRTVRFSPLRAGHDTTTD